MQPYHKIQTVFNRDPENNHKTLLEGEWATPAFEYLKDNQWVFTEKIDGTNIRVHWNGERVEYGGRTDRAQIQAKLFQALVDTVGIEQLSHTFEGATDVTLYGEGFGATVQKGGGNYRQDQGFILFDVFIGDIWLERSNVEDIGDSLGVPVVPVMAAGTLQKAVNMVKDGMISTFGTFPAEGLVMRPAIELFDRRGARVISKVKAKDFAS